MHLHLSIAFVRPRAFLRSCKSFPFPCSKKTEAREASGPLPLVSEPFVDDHSCTSAHTKESNGAAAAEMTTSKDKGADQDTSGSKRSNGSAAAPPQLEKRQSQSSAQGDDGKDKKDNPRKRRKVNHGELFSCVSSIFLACGTDWRLACIYCRRSVSDSPVLVICAGKANSNVQSAHDV